MILGETDLIGASLFILSNHQLEEHVCPCAVLGRWVVSWSYFDPHLSLGSLLVWSGMIFTIMCQYP